MKNINKIIVASTVLALACSKENPDKKAQLEGLIKQQSEIAAQIKTLQAEIALTDTTKKEVKSKMVAITAIEPQTFSHFIEIQGKVETDRNVIVSAESGGVITKMYAKEGDKVRKGQVLAEIDAILLRKGIDELNTQLELANVLFEKQEKLWKENIGTEVQYLQAKTGKEALEAKKASLNEQLKKAKIVASIDGYLDVSYKKLGEMVGPGMPVFQVINFTEYKVTGELAESYIGNVNVGDEVLVSFPDLKKEFKSKIAVVGSAINNVNRTFKIEINVPPSNATIKPNMIAYLKIKDFSKSNAIVVPINTIQSSRDDRYVYVAEANKAVRKTVLAAETYGNVILITKGLQIGEKLITTGYSDLADGQNITY